MLSEKTKAIIKQTVPILEQSGVELTKLFYKKMLGENPFLLNIFNKKNQETGDQPTALAKSVLAAAKNIDDLSKIIPVVKQIGYKHKALQVKADHYPIVGKYLILAIDELLHPGKEVLDAWTAAYQVIADVFISVEKEMYDNELWHGWQPFKVIRKTKINEKGDFYEFIVKNEEVLTNTQLIKPGEYITVRVKPKGELNYALRHYSICGVEGLHNGELKFATKLLVKNGKKGLVSHYLIDEIQLGDTLDISAPSGGDFSLNTDLISQNKYPIIFISAGSGITPLIFMLETQVKLNKNRKVIWIQSNQYKIDQPFKEKVEELLSYNSENKNIQIFTQEGDHRIDLDFLKFNVPADGDVYVCGGLEFMKDILGYLAHLQIVRVRHEAFGPQISLLK